MDNVISSAKTDMFRIRMNPEIREELEQIYAKTGLTLTDAINVFSAVIKCRRFPLCSDRR